MIAGTNVADVADVGAQQPSPPSAEEPRAPEKGRRRGRGSGLLLPTATTILILLIWELLSRMHVLPTEVPPVTSILAALVELVPTAAFWSSLAATLEQFGIGLLAGGVIGIALGVVLGGIPLLYQITHYVLDFLRSIPAVVYLPVLILIFGATPRVGYILGAVGALWPLLFQTYYGVAGVTPLLKDTARVFGLRPHQRLIHVTLPAVSPFVATGLRIAASHVLVVVVAVEIISSVTGIGSDIAIYATNAVYPGMYALVLVVGLLGVLVNFVLERIERRQLHWHASYREVEG